MIPRMVESRLREALSDTPVVMIAGPRQCGKSTLSQQLESERSTVTLDDPLLLHHARSNPIDFLASHPAPLTIDEVQRAPELFLALKLLADRHRQPGSYLLTGSANVLALPKIADSLAGRMEVIDLHPLAQCEIEGAGFNWVDRAFALDFPKSGQVLDPRPLSGRIARGGFPEPFQRPAARRSAWFQSYVRTLLERDVRDLANIDGLTQLPRLLRWLASSTGSTLNLSGLVRETGLPHTTVTRYVDLLKALYLIQTIPAWSADLKVRLTRTPKCYLVDTGLACELNRVPEAALGPGSPRGPMLELLVATELRRQLGCSEIGGELYHLRTVKLREVPFLLESQDGRIVAVDIADEQTPGVRAGAKLEYVRDLVGNAFVAGYWLHTGTEIRPLSHNLIAQPISCLWMR